MPGSDGPAPPAADAAMPDAELVRAVREGDRRAVSRAITLVESGRPDHRRRAERLVDALLPNSGGSIRMGVTGVPGVGKSTLIEALGGLIIERGHTIAVLSVDPSSALTGGSILGDKTRMETLSRSPRAYIRPSPARGVFGGVGRRTRESIVILEAAGFDVVIVETVGVGQSETLVADMTDLFLLLLLPGGGDELQGIKRGIMELADIVAVNKADDDRLDAAGQTRADYGNALRLMPHRYRDWQVPVLACSARDGVGIEELWNAVKAFVAATRAEGAFDRRREAQRLHWFHEELNQGLVDLVRRDERLASRMKHAEAEVRANRLSAAGAAHRLVEEFSRSRIHPS